MQDILKCIMALGLTIAAGPAGAQILGPETFDAAGGSKKLMGITHEYAIGQVVAGDSYVRGGLVVTPGVLQPVRTTRVTDLHIQAGELQVFPDPVETTLYLLPAFRKGGTLQYALFDAAGALVFNREAVLKTGTERQDLPVSHIAGGQYILRVSWITEGSTTRTSGYKILKMR